MSSNIDNISETIINLTGQRPLFNFTRSGLITLKITDLTMPQANATARRTQLPTSSAHGNLTTEQRLAMYAMLLESTVSGKLSCGALKPAVGRPHYDHTKKRLFDGKIGIWPFVEIAPAQRSSKNRPK
ncbi:hypothetical protein H257_07946 [Aphanomyces astaci]|uniref:Uncharacterized protein n=1 Tax=Aphanomyces astaci TaxID=112090 RepID=W4GH55_APHAT|nr:hypothetical protein H257_07946 [Aphanomyces astaci]ETV78384.1 hypothetical protein H257_07946 [Aphanomyces astaci]|eukprot:XP_009831965.1 hypothetical protein H257_07946 [Aphanomyces astaci]